MTTPPTPSAPTARGSVIVHVYARTDVGRTREHNEDSFLVADLSSGQASSEGEVGTHTVGDRGTLFMVADGLGGAAAGEVASTMAVDIVLAEMRQRWVNVAARDPETFAVALKKSTESANLQIYEYAQRNPEHRGLGTTATLAGLLKDTLYIAQVGDSRGYLIRDGGVDQITKDQSLMQRLIEAGELTPEEAEQSERRNIILQALGPEPSVKIDLTHQKLRRGDVLVLCTDGLSGLVKKEEIAEVIHSEPDLAHACSRLIDRANENGGPDNITVVLARFEGDGLQHRVEGDRVGHEVFPFTTTTPTQPTPMLHTAAQRPANPFERTEPSTPMPVVLVPRKDRANQLMLYVLVAGLLLAVVLFAATKLHELAGRPAPTSPPVQDSAAGTTPTPPQ